MLRNERNTLFRTDPLKDLRPVKGTEAAEVALCETYANGLEILERPESIADGGFLYP